MTVLICAAVLLTPACGGDSVGNSGTTVGGACQSNADCDERCLTNGDFPQGTCSVSCRDDADCPSGTACIDKDGGICLLTCDVNADCRPGYDCEGKSRKDNQGDVLVCID